MHTELAAVPSSLYHVTRANRVIAVVSQMQTLTLTPVIELGYYNQGNDMPPLHQKAVSSHEWQEYRTECMRLAGMPEPIPPDIPGTDFFTVGSFSDQRLEWLINQHVSEYIRNQPQQISPFCGGYILGDKFGTLLNPQCCGDLSDVIWWKHVCYLKECVCYNGHPCPVLRFHDDIIEFICQEDWEQFDPITKPQFSVKQAQLVSAYEAMIPALLSFKESITQVLSNLNWPHHTEIDLASLLTVRNRELNEEDPIG